MYYVYGHFTHCKVPHHLWVTIIATTRKLEVHVNCITQCFSSSPLRGYDEQRRNYVDKNVAVHLSNDKYSASVYCLRLRQSAHRLTSVVYSAEQVGAVPVTWYKYWPSGLNI